MTRRFWTAALATALAGGVYLAGATAQASNMGFKLERDVDAERNAVTGRALVNTHWISFPYFNGLGDVANTSHTTANKCVGDATGPTAGDGIINSHDALCDFWGSRVLGNSGGAMSLTMVDSGTCQFVSTIGRIVLGNPNFSGQVFPSTGDLDTSIGYQINFGVGSAHPPADPWPRNRIVIVGSHDPAFTGLPITYSPTCGTGGPPCCNSSRAARAILAAMPYHTMWEMSAETLCGLRGVDWPDVDNNWLPDDPTDPSACDNGIFDGTRRISLTTVKNDDPSAGGTSGFVFQAAFRQNVPAPPRVVLSPSTPYALIPGEAYQISLELGHTPTNYLSPHF